MERNSVLFIYSNLLINIFSLEYFISNLLNQNKKNIILLDQKILFEKIHSYDFKILNIKIKNRKKYLLNNYFIKKISAFFKKKFFELNLEINKTK